MPVEGKALSSQAFAPMDHISENGEWVACLLLGSVENVKEENKEFRALNVQLKFCRKDIKLDDDSKETLISCIWKAKFFENQTKGFIMRGS